MNFEKLEKTLNRLYRENKLSIDTYTELMEFAEPNQKVFSDSFNASVNGKRLADKMNKLFAIQLQPKIKRFIKNDIKFLMINEFGEVYEFKGIVLDFLANDITIELDGNVFNIK